LFRVGSLLLITINVNYDEKAVSVSNEAYIYEAIRTPRGKNRAGSLHGTKPIDLVVGLINELKAPYCARVLADDSWPGS
jgi:acetyl-CoA acetyltransferase